MPGTLEICRPTGYRKGSRPLRGARPWSFFVMEELLAARAESQFPTNGMGPDEDVNVYLAHLLAGFLGGHSDLRVLGGVEPLILPAQKSASRTDRAEHYRVNGDHRLLHLGLMDRGDAIRRRRSAFGSTAGATRVQGMATGKLCYAQASNLLAGRNRANSGLAPVLAKLSDHFEDYVHVLTATAVRRLGLGSKLRSGELARLGRTEETIGGQNGNGHDRRNEDELTVRKVLSEELHPDAMDSLLDLMLEYRRQPDPVTWARITYLADRLQVDPRNLVSGRKHT